MTDTAGPPSLWRNRSYMCYRMSRAVSMLGSRMSGLAFFLLVLDLGYGAVLAGTISTTALIVRMAMQLPAGQLADRFDQRRLMMAMDAVRLIAVGSIPLVAAIGQLTFAQLLAAAVIEGAASAVFGSTAMVFIRVAVPPEQFAQAMSQSQASYGAMALVGPVLGGALYEVDHMLPFIADASSYLLGGALLFLVAMPGRHQAGGDPAEGEQEDKRITAGFWWLWHNRSILRIVIFGAVLNLVGAASGVAAMVVMNQRGVPASVIGTVMAFGGSGMIVGSLVVTRVMRLGPFRLYAIAGFLWAGSFGLLAISTNPWLVAAVLAFLAAIGPSTGVMLFQILADKAPKNLYGRVNAAETLLSSSLATVGPFMAGVMVTAFGGTYLWLVLAGMCVAATAVTVPWLVSFDKPEPATPETPEVGETRSAEDAVTDQWDQELDGAREPEVVAHDFPYEDLPFDVNQVCPIFKEA